MSLIIHHLQVSQSERIPWLCEELDIPYRLVLHQRAPFLSPQSIKDLNPLGSAPVIQDRDLILAESAACVEYIIHVHGNGRLALPPSHSKYADYLYWFRFANGTFQPTALMLLQFSRIGSAGAYAASLGERFQKQLELIDSRLQKNAWLAGNEFTAADVMIFFTLTTMRTFYPYDLSEYPGILAYLAKVTAREGYKKARAKADPELELMIDGRPPRMFAERLKAEGKI